MKHEIRNSTPYINTKGQATTSLIYVCSCKRTFRGERNINKHLHDAN